MRDHSQYNRTLKPDIKLPRDKPGILGNRLDPPPKRGNLNANTLKKYNNSINAIVNNSFNRICIQLDFAKTSSTQHRIFFKKRSH